MKTKELLEEIKEDKTLNKLIANLKEAEIYAQDRTNRINKKQGELKVKLSELRKNPSASNFYDVDSESFQNEFYKRETQGELLLKIYLLEQSAQRSWTLDKNYIKAKKEYYEYIIHLLKKVEEEKRNNKMIISDLQQKYEEELLEPRKNVIQLETKIEELMSNSNDLALYSYNEQAAHIWGGKASDECIINLLEGLIRNNKLDTNEERRE